MKLILTYHGKKNKRERENAKRNTAEGAFIWRDCHRIRDKCDRESKSSEI